MAKIEIKENIDMFRCPICGKRMETDALKSIVCLNKHCFDLSKKGYVNFLLSPVKTDYDKKMFASRRIIFDSGFFDPMMEQVSELIIEKAHNKYVDKIKILDAGCGEGSHLAQLISNLCGGTGANIQGVGIDISKEGIQIAARKYPESIWCVANLAKTPFTDKQFNMILNILSPSNYAEFNRIIKEDGILVKIVPGDNYLKELRSAFYKQTDKGTYSNERVVKLFSDKFEILAVRQILYTMTVKENIEHLVKMTPLSWGAADEKIQKVLDYGLNNITVDLSVILGKKKS